MYYIHKGDGSTAFERSVTNVTGTLFTEPIRHFISPNMFDYLTPNMNYEYTVFKQLKHVTQVNFVAEFNRKRLLKATLSHRIWRHVISDVI